ncbi:hypothetical protein [Streptomyces sp. NPDC051636]|uniref:hypothetical protein n=1 Tax=Streptomyces sp. NPDC051636 TaxID=3365663 RepID=UPI00379B3542
MSTATAVLITAAVLAFSLPAAYWQIRRAQRHESVRDRIIRESCEYAGLAAQVDDLELCWDLPAYQRPDPDLDAGCDRLWDAIRDHREDQP